MSRLSRLTTPLARLKTDDYVGMRRMSVRLPQARREKAELPPEMVCHNAG